MTRSRVEPDEPFDRPLLLPDTPGQQSDGSRSPSGRRNPVAALLLRPRQLGGGAGAVGQGASPRAAVGTDRGGRGLPGSRRPREPRLPGPDAEDPVDVRTSWAPVRVLHLRHALVCQRRVRRRRGGVGGAAAGRRTLTGIDEMRAARPAAARDRDLGNGPAKLCQAMGIDGSHDGVDLVDGRDPHLIDDGTPPPAEPGGHRPRRPAPGRRSAVALARRAVTSTCPRRARAPGSSRAEFARPSRADQRRRRLPGCRSWSTPGTTTSDRARVTVGMTRPA